MSRTFIRFADSVVRTYGSSHQASPLRLTDVADIVEHIYGDTAPQSVLQKFDAYRQAAQHDDDLLADLSALAEATAAPPQQLEEATAALDQLLLLRSVLAFPPASRLSMRAGTALVFRFLKELKISSQRQGQQPPQLLVGHLRKGEHYSVQLPTNEWVFDRIKLEYRAGSSYPWVSTSLRSFSNTHGRVIDAPLREQRDNENDDLRIFRGDVPNGNIRTRAVSEPVICTFAGVELQLEPNSHTDMLATRFYDRTDTCLLEIIRGCLKRGV